MRRKIPLSPLSALIVVTSLAVLAQVPWRAAHAQGDPEPSLDSRPSLEESFQQHIQPLLTKYCLRCHNTDKMESGIRVDSLQGTFDDKQLFLGKEILKQVADETMPPEDELQPTAEQRRMLVGWIQRAMSAASAFNPRNQGSIRRLTVAQYRNTLRDLLGLADDLTNVLPPDGVSQEGFANNAESMQLSPLLLEAYFDIAERALDLCIVDDRSKPAIQNFRMDLGEAINSKPCPDELILGANSHLLRNEDFVVSQLTPAKPFEYDPLDMRQSFRFIEGYQGNATVRGWREYDSIYHAVFACMRGTDGYPKGDAYETVPGGLLLRAAIPSPEIFGSSSTYGPMANFKISLRELPDRGRFRVTVTAARYEDALLLDAGTPIHPVEQAADAVTVAAEDLFAAPAASAAIQHAGVYQVDAFARAGEKPETLSLMLGERRFSGRLTFPPAAMAGDAAEGGRAESGAAFMLVRLPAGPLTLAARYGDNTRLGRVVFTRLADGSAAARRFEMFEQRLPIVGVHLGLRRDCGSTLARVGPPQPVASHELNEFVFEGAINNFPSPDVELDNVNYLAGLREIGVRSEFTDGRDRPRLLVRSVEFEGPLYGDWPPATHRRIFIDSDRQHDPAAYARDIIRSFATRAFRRPVTAREEASLAKVWEDSFADHGDFRQSIKDALLVVLTSPQFLFLIESSDSAEAEQLDSYELASKLSYFLWNTAPDRRLLEHAAAGTLRDALDAEIDRLVRDPRFQQFAREFVSQWLSLDKFDVLEVDRTRYPKLTRDTKAQLRAEPVEFLRYLVQQNLPLRNLIQSDFIVANEAVADYYGLAERTESGFAFVRVQHDSEHLGGVLTQASILAGLSDGRESNPVKRGAWLARKIIAEPPDDPPPNVPALGDDTSGLTLREKLERHRDQPGCAKCHEGIDPWGIPFERFDAGGLLKNDPDVDTRSTLPDGAEVDDLNELRAYLAGERIDRVAFSFVKHLASYAVGRSLSYNEVEFLERSALELKPAEYPLRDLLRFIIKSELFLEK